MPNNNLLLFASHLSRGLVPLANRLSHNGLNVTVAAPQNDNSEFLRTKFIKLRKIGSRLIGAKELKNFDGVIIALDDITQKFSKKHKIKSVKWTDQIGVDLSVWNPAKTSGNRQTMLLSRYNILPHQKMLFVPGITERDVNALILAIQGLNRDDFVLALYGKMPYLSRLRIYKRIKSIPQIIYIGDNQDLPTTMRASFAIISLSPNDDFYKIAGMAMGRTTAFVAGNIKPNILIKDLQETIKTIIDLPTKKREQYEYDNVINAQNCNLEKNIEKIKNMVK